MAVRHKIIKNRNGCHWGKAADVAEAITKKAMEHLFKPLKDEEHAIAEEAYQLALKKCKLTDEQLRQMVACNIVDFSMNITVEIRDKNGNETNVETHNMDEKVQYIDSGWRRTTVVTNDDLYSRAVDFKERWNDLHAKATDMKDAVMAQVNNRSTKEVFADWPEAVPIVAKVMEIELDRPALLKPLEMLLAKFMPALPAPKA